MKTLKFLGCLVLIALLFGCMSTKNGDDTQRGAYVVGEVENQNSQAKVTYNVSGANLGELTTNQQTFHGYARGIFIPGETFRLWGTIQNQGKSDDVLLIRVKVTIWSSDHPRGINIEDTGILRLSGGSTYGYDYTVDILGNAHQVAMEVGTTALYNSSWTAHFNAKLILDE